MQELRRIRKERGLTQRGLADASGVDPATISLIETGKRRPHLETLDSLALVLGVEVIEFFPKVQASLWPEEEPERRNPEPSDAQRRLAKVDELAAEYLVGRAEKHDVEVTDPNSPHFANATAAALWLAGVEDERTAWLDWLRDLWEITMPSGDLGAGMKQVVDRWFAALGTLAAFDLVETRAEERIRAMNDTPDELAARRLEVATTAAEASMKRLEDRREAASG